MKISEVAGKSGLSIDTIRFYEKSGICPAIARGTDGIRRFSPENLEWLILLGSLRETGMPTAQMKHFANLYQVGDRTVSARKSMLVAHAQELERHHRRLDECQALLARKIAKYDEILGEDA
ncbi:MAG: MerR family transcriptional regulator [Paracoccaceae bacterium]